MDEISGNSNNYDHSIISSEEHPAHEIIKNASPPDDFWIALRDLCLAMNWKIWEACWNQGVHDSFRTGAFVTAMQVHRYPVQLNAEIAPSADYTMQYYQEHGLELVRTLTKTDLKYYKNYLAEKDIWAMTPEEFKSMTAEYWGPEANAARANLIFQNEQHTAFVNGQDLYIREEVLPRLSENVKVQKEWRHSHMSKVPRPHHLAIDHEKVDIDKSFSNGLMKPEGVNCRCTLEYHENIKTDNEKYPSPYNNLSEAREKLEQVFITKSDQTTLDMLSDKSIRYLADQNPTFSSISERSASAIGAVSSGERGVLLDYTRIADNTSLHELGHAITTPPTEFGWSKLVNLDKGINIESDIFEVFQAESYGIRSGLIDTSRASETWADLFRSYNSPRESLLIRESAPNTYEALKNVLGPSKWDTPIDSELSNFMRVVAKDSYIGGDRYLRALGLPAKESENVIDLLFPSGNFTNNELSSYESRIENATNIIKSFIS